MVSTSVQSLKGGTAVIETQIEKEVNLLLSKVTTRLHNHVSTRIHDDVKRTHWCLQWAAANFPRLSAVIYLFDMVQQDLACATENCSLLSRDMTKFMSVNSASESFEGCYLYCNQTLFTWVRSGKAVGHGSNFVTRHNAHVEGSKLLTVEAVSSMFYTSYPDTQSTHSNDSIRRGYFQNLVQCVGLGFDRANKVQSITLVTQLIEGSSCGQTTFCKRLTKSVFEVLIH